MCTFHGPPQVAVDSRLVSLALSLHPGENIGINPNRQRLLDGPIELSHDGVAPIRLFRNIRKINVFIYRAEEPRTFWVDVALYYLGGVWSLGYFLYKIYGLSN
jgi:hypothetical protein